MKRPSPMLKIGLIGTLITALCCFTPLLMVVLGTLGLGSVVVYLDILLLPALAVFIGITLLALVRRRKNHRD